MRRRDFLKVIGLSVATPSFLVAEDGTPPKRQNPDFIKTGFPTIDECLGGGFRRGTFNSVGGYNRSPYEASLLLKTLAFNAACDLQQRSSVLFISPPEKFKSTQSTPFDGLLMHSHSIDWSAIGNYDMVIIDREPLQNVKESAALARTLQRIAYETNTVVVQRNQLFCHTEYILNGGSSYPMFLSTTALAIRSFGNMQMRLPTLEILKNRYGACATIELVRPSVHFYEEPKVWI